MNFCLPLAQRSQLPLLRIALLLTFARLKLLLGASRARGRRSSSEPALRGGDAHRSVTYAP